MRAVVVVVAGMLFVSACGNVDVAESSEYLSLQSENESLANDLEDMRVEFGVSERRLQELDDRLDESQSQLSQAEQSDLEIRADFADFLVYQFSNSAGLTETQATCLSENLVEDDGARAAYFVLLESNGVQSPEVVEAYAGLGDLFETCDLDLPPLDDADVAAELPQEVADAVRPVEVIGVALPRLTNPDPAADPAVGTKAPVLAGESYDGQAVRIDGALSGPTMVVVVAHWCPHCNAEVPRLNQLRDEGRIPAGVSVVAISSAVNSDAPNFPPDVWISDMGWTFPVLADGVDLQRDVFIASEAFGVSGFPFGVLIDGDGIVVERWAGERDPDEIIASLEALVGGA